ncbi:MAG: hypothetical protein RR400_02160, partial [Clostridia bacterium]
MKSIKALSEISNEIKKNDLIKYGGKAMYEYKFSDNFFSNKKSKKNLSDSLKEIEDKYSFKFNPDVTLNDKELNLEKLQFSPLSKDEIENNAKNSLEEYAKTGKENILNEFDGLSKNYDKLKKEKEESIFGDKKRVEKLFEDAKESTSNQALRRGLARSSIVVNNLQAFEKGKLDEIKKMDETFTKDIGLINEKKSLLETQKSNALSNFDISYAVKLNDKIGKLNAEMEKKQSEVIKFNNDIERQEKEFAEKQEKLNFAESEEIRKNNKSLTE